MANRVIAPLLDRAASDLIEPVMNWVRLGLDPRGLASRIVNLTEVRAAFRRRISRQLALAPDHELSVLYDDYLAASPGEADADDAVADIVLPMILRDNGQILRLFSTITTFGTPMDVTLAEIAVESYYPADAETDAYLKGLAS